MGSISISGARLVFYISGVDGEVFYIRGGWRGFLYLGWTETVSIFGVDVEAQEVTATSAKVIKTIRDVIALWVSIYLG